VTAREGCICIGGGNSAGPHQDKVARNVASRLRSDVKLSTPRPRTGASLWNVWTGGLLDEGGRGRHLGTAAGTFPLKAARSLRDCREIGKARSVQMGFNACGSFTAAAVCFYCLGPHWIRPDGRTVKAK
jgi:hypothetical protein